MLNVVNENAELTSLKFGLVGGTNDQIARGIGGENGKNSVIKQLCMFTVSISEQIH